MNISSSFLDCTPKRKGCFSKASAGNFKEFILLYYLRLLYQVQAAVLTSPNIQMLTVNLTLADSLLGL